MISNSLSELYLLVEAELKIKQLLKQFPQFSQEQIEQFAQFDPTPGKSYITWILRMVKDNKLRLPEDGNNIFQALLSFTKFKNDPRLKNNINDYKSPGDLYQTLEYFDFFESKTQKRKQYDEAKSNEGSQLLVDQDGIKIVKVQNVQTAMQFAQGTKWCVEDEENAKHYLRQGPLYFIYKNNQPYALLHVESNQLKDVYDDELEEEDRLALKPYFVENKIMHPKIYDFAIMNNYDPNNYTEQDALMLFSQDVATAYRYAISVLKGRFPEGESAIAKDTYSSYYYAISVLKGRFPEGESAIANNAGYAYYYAIDILKGRFPEGEPVIAKDADYAYRYALNVIKGRFPEGEPAIAKDAYCACYYALNVLKGRFPEGEKTIATDAQYAYEYARYVIKGKFPEGESAIATDAELSYYYARDILKGRFPEGEDIIANNAEYAYRYARYVIKGRFPEGEQTILNSQYKDDYLQLIGENDEESLDNNEESMISNSLSELYLLVEAELKIKQLLKQFPQFSQEQIEQFAQFDPTPGKSYITWILRMVKNNKLRLPEDGNNIFQALSSFTKFKNDPRIKNNINDYKSPGDLYQTLEYFNFFESKTQKRKQYDEAKSNEGSQLLVDQDGIKIVKVQNVQTAMQFAQGTQWCVENEENAKHYLRQGPLYFIYKNNQPYALLHVESNQLKNVYDDELEEEDRLALKPYFVENKIMHPKIYDFAIMNNYDPNNYTEQDALMLFSQDASTAYEYAISVLKGRFPEGEPVIAKDASYAYAYARNILKGRFPEAEQTIAKDAEYAYNYALNVIEGRFPEGEPVIAKDASYAYDYARDVLKRRFPEGEKTIAKDAQYAYYYARDIIDGRFPEGEQVIAKNAQYAYYYARDIIDGRFPEGEQVIAKNAYRSYEYAVNALKGRFPEGEKAIAKYASYAYRYARDVIKGRFPEGEQVIAKDASYAYNYALYVLKGRFPEAESVIANNAYYAYNYVREVIKGRFPEGEQTILNSQYKDDYLQLIGENDEESLDNNYENPVISSQMRLLYKYSQNDITMTNLEQLIEHARQFDNFEDFEKAWSLEIRHGQYWHVTDNPEFFIDPTKGPRDMSSMANGEIDIGKLMITSDLENWDSYYNWEDDETRRITRPFAVELDMSNVPFKEWRQVRRGFGNEFIVNDTSKIKIIRILPIEKALEISAHYHENIKPQSENELYKLWEEAHDIVESKMTLLKNLYTSSNAEKKKIISNSLSQLYKYSQQIEELKSQDFDSILKLRQDVYKSDNPSMFEESNEQLKFIQQMENFIDQGLSTQIFVNDKKIGFSLVSLFDDVMKFHPVQLNIIRNSGINMREFEQSINNGEVAVLFDFAILQEYRNLFLFHDFLIHIFNQLKQNNVKYLISSFRDKTSGKLLKLLESEGMGSDMAEVIVKQKDPFIQSGNEDFYFTVLKLK